MSFRNAIFLLMLCLCSDVLNGQIRLLPEVYVDAVMVQHGDTLAYSASALQKEADRTIEDLLRRIPGIDIQPDGQITYNEKPITHFYVEGLDLLSGRYTLLTQQMKPEELASIEVIEHHQHIKLLKDYVPNDRAAINIRLKKKRLSHPIGYAHSAAGIVNQTLEHELDGQLMSFSNLRQYIVKLQHEDNSAISNPLSISMDQKEDEPTKLQLTKSPFDESLWGLPTIPRKRFLSGNLWEAQANALHKIHSDDQLRVIAGVWDSRNQYEQSRVGCYYDADTCQLEKVGSAMHSHQQQALVSLLYEHNTDACYLMHKSTLSMERHRNDYSFSSDAPMQLKVNTYDYDGHLVWYRKAGGSLFKCEANMQAVQQPTDMNDDTLYQLFRLSMVAADISSSYLYSIGPEYGAGIETNIAFCHENLCSKQTGSLEAENKLLEDQVRFLSFAVSLNPFFQFSRSKASLRVALPFELTSIHARNCMHDLCQRATPLALGGYMKGVLRVTPTIRMDAQLTYSSWHGSAEDLAVSPVRTSRIHQSVMGNGTLSGGHRLFSELHFYYRNPINGSSASLSASGQRLSQEQTPASIYIAPVYTDFLIDQPCRDKKWQMSGVLFQNFYDLEWTAKLSGRYFTIRSALARGLALFAVRQNVGEVSLQIEKFFWRRKICLRNSGSFRHSSILMKRQKHDADDINLHEDLVDSHHAIVFSPIVGLDFTISLDNQWICGQQQASHYLDATVRWHADRHEVEFIGTNLTDEKAWQSVKIDGLDYYEYRYFLRRAECVVAYKYSF